MSPGILSAPASSRRALLWRRAAVAAALVGATLGLDSPPERASATSGTNSASTVEVPPSLHNLVDDITYQGMSSTARERFKDMATWHEPYILIDKPNATGYVIGADHRIQAIFPVLLGRERGEQPNIVNVKVDAPGSRGATTPAGMFRLSRARLTEEDLREYNDNILRLEGPGTGGNCIHETWQVELSSREHALATPTPEDNRVSAGCVNVSRAIFETHVKPLPSGTRVWITPDT
jgi:lipoprotein-anchoring transpeptidase ErfK/SrfK